MTDIQTTIVDKFTAEFANHITIVTQGTVYTYITTILPGKATIEIAISPTGGLTYWASDSRLFLDDTEITTVIAWCRNCLSH